jgi:hypothetical protein
VTAMTSAPSVSALLGCWKRRQTGWHEGYTKFYDTVCYSDGTTVRGPGRNGHINTMILFPCKMKNVR